MTLVSGSTRIFAVSWRGGVKRQWGNRKREFSGLLSDAVTLRLARRHFAGTQ